MKELYNKWVNISLIKRIIAELLAGTILALNVPEKASGLSILGDLFVGALKAVAPILVFFLLWLLYYSIKKGKNQI